MKRACVLLILSFFAFSCAKEKDKNKENLCNALAVRSISSFDTLAPIGDFEALKFFKCDQEKVASFLIDYYGTDIFYFHVKRENILKEKNAVFEKSTFAFGLSDTEDKDK